VPLEVPQKNVVDSSGWIKYFADGPNSGFFEAAILDAGSLVVLSTSIYELFKRLLIGDCNDVEPEDLSLWNGTLEGVLCLPA
jgi:hypothetical protein